MFDGTLKEHENMRVVAPQDDADPHPLVVAHAERLAVVETKVDGLRDDTGIIRSHIHGINQEIQKVVAIEQRCESALAQLLGLTKEIPTIAASAAAFAEMKEQIESVIVDRQQRQGAWRAMVIVGSAFVGAVTVGGSLVGGMLWLLGRLH